MQAIAAKDQNGKIYFLGLDKKAYPANGVISVDEEWEVEVVSDLPERYTVKPVKKLGKQTGFKIEGIPPNGPSCRDLLYRTTNVGERIIKKEFVREIGTIGDCRGLPYDLRKQLVPRRVAWERWRRILVKAISWPEPGEAKEMDAFGICGTACSTVTNRTVSYHFVCDGFTIKGPVKKLYQQEDARIGKLLLDGYSLEVLLAPDKEDFLLSFFGRAKIRCGDIVVPFPEGVYRKADLIKYFTDKAKEEGN